MFGGEIMLVDVEIFATVGLWQFSVLQLVVSHRLLVMAMS